LKKIFVNSLSEGNSVEEVFFVKESSLRTARTGSLYLDAVLADRTGSIPAKLWRAEENTLQRVPRGGYVRVRGFVESYRNTLQLKIEDAAPVRAEDIDPQDYHAASERDVEEMKEEMKGLVGAVKGRDLKKLLGRVFDGPFAEEFASAPAASSYHHAYRGGLLEHTVAVAKAARACAKLDPRLDPDLLLAGALLHDVGKAHELACDPGPDYTDEGRLLGHMFLGAKRVDEAIASTEGFPPLLRLRLLHMILSHHGQHEFGAPVLPATPEALALHHLDNIDAKVQAAAPAIEPDASDGNWTDYMRMLSVRVFKKKEEG